MFGIGVGAMALIVVLSAFNGINSLVESLYSSFDAEIRIEPAKGKTFVVTDSLLTAIRGVDEVKQVSRSLEEIVLVKYKKNQVFARLKGVDTAFLQMSNMDSLLFAGSPHIVRRDGAPMMMVGYIIADKLGLFIQNAFKPLYVYAAKPTKGNRVTMEDAFYIEPIMPSGIYSVNADIDARYVVAPYSFAEKLLNKHGRVSAIELSLKPKSNPDKVRDKLAALIGDSFVVKTRYQLNEILYKTNNTEKWATFLILSFILLIATFNVIGSLTILILDKKRDIFILKGMGATASLIRKVFFTEGMLIAITGGLSGMALGAVLVVLQDSFGFIRIEGLLVDHYPVELHVFDMVAVAGLIVFVGALAASIPVRIVTRRLA